MSAFIINRTSDRIEIVADGGGYQPRTGIVDAIFEKIVIMPGLPLAMVSRGMDVKLGKFFTGWAVGLAQEAGSVDAALTIVGTVLHARREQFLSAPMMQFAFTGFSETRGAISQMVNSFEGTVDGLPRPAGELFDLPDLMITNVGGPPQYYELEAAGLTLTNSPPDMLEQHGVAAMKMLRRKPMPAAEYGSERDMFLIGGHVQYVSITGDGATSRIVHTWPDKIGEPIRP